MALALYCLALALALALKTSGLGLGLVLPGLGLGLGLGLDTVGLVNITAFKDAHTEVAQEVLGFCEYAKHEWISDTSRSLVEKKRTARLKHV